MEPKAFEIYRHFKGNLYQVMTLAEEEATGNMLVVYQGLYAPFKVYARPLSGFLERLDPMKYPDAAQVYRFERVANIETVAAPAEEISAASTKENSVASTEEISDASREEILAWKSSPPALEEDMTKTPSQSAPEADMTKTSSQTVSESDMTETAEGINPDLLLFLDAREPEEKLDALFRIKNRLTPDMLTVIEMSQGMEPQETWSIEERYKHIKNDIITKQKYEQKRI